MYQIWLADSRVILMAVAHIEASLNIRPLKIQGMKTIQNTAHVDSGSQRETDRYLSILDSPL